MGNWIKGLRKASINPDLYPVRPSCNPLNQMLDQMAMDIRREEQAMADSDERIVDQFSTLDSFLLGGTSTQAFLLNYLRQRPGREHLAMCILDVRRFEEKFESEPD